jgi:hypothetical protein
MSDGRIDIERFMSAFKCILVIVCGMQKFALSFEYVQGNYNKKWACCQLIS